jgi:tRNA(fMet)-specific endonuclease VapC
MSRYLLDNGILVAYLKGRPEAVRLVRPWITAREAATSHVIYGEAVEYIKSDPDYRRRHSELRALLREVTPYKLTYAILERYADVRRAMRRGSGLIGDIDTLIAATALEHGLTVVTLDADFTRVPGLMVMRLSRAALMASK